MSNRQARLPAQPGRLRKDAAENRRRLLEAAGEILRTSPHDATMPTIARMAGVGPATAYRYFPSLETLLNSYLHEVVTQLRDFSHDQTATGPALFTTTVREWLRLVSIYGPAMVQLRSRRGILERLHTHDEVIVAVRDAWERPIRAVLRHEGIEDQHFDGALLIYNALFDPREILDLHASGFTFHEIERRLTTAFTFAVRGWAAT